MEATNTAAVEVKFPKTLQEAVITYNDPQACIDVIASLRWPEGAVCPHCGGKVSLYMAKYRRWQCKEKSCKKQFTVKMGTIFEDSPLGLDKWLIAMWLIANCKNGVSSYEIARGLSITQKTAWFLLHRIRQAMTTGSFEKMSGTVEVDETFVGGLEKNKHKDKKLNAGRGAVGKAVVMGLLERGDKETGRPSRVTANVIADTSSESLHPEIKAAVAPGTEVISDAHRGYNGLEDDYIRSVVDHAVKYAEGRVYTNGIENFWSLTKRALKGTYVSVEPEHLLAYIDEQAFRFNERGTKDGGRFLTVLAGVEGKRLTYKTLIGDPQGIDSPDPLRGGPRAD